MKVTVKTIDSGREVFELSDEVQVLLVTDPVITLMSFPAHSRWAKGRDSEEDGELT